VTAAFNGLDLPRPLKALAQNHGSTSWARNRQVEFSSFPGRFKTGNRDNHHPVDAEEKRGGKETYQNDRIHIDRGVDYVLTAHFDIQPCKSAKRLASKTEGEWTVFSFNNDGEEARHEWVAVNRGGEESPKRMGSKEGIKTQPIPPKGCAMISKRR